MGARRALQVLFLWNPQEPWGPLACLGAPSPDCGPSYSQGVQVPTASLEGRFGHN